VADSVRDTREELGGAEDRAAIAEATRLDSAARAARMVEAWMAVEEAMGASQ
jgi:hypothetical protein